MQKLLLCIGLLGMLHTNAQLHPILDNFNIVQIGNSVQINFAIQGGASCVGVDLERSDDSFNFEIVGSISGVCGGSEFVEFYSLPDENPIRGEKSFYRLRLGSQGRSELVEFTFVPLENGLKVFPNPASDQCFVRFDNSNSSPHVVQLIDQRGRTLRSFETSSSQVEFDLNDLLSGIYLIRIDPVSGGQKVMAKLVKV